MSDKAIIVENLSKRYRIGLKEKMHDTLGGALLSWIKSPIENFRNLRRLTKFDEEPETVNGDSEIDPSPFTIHDSRSSDIIWALRDVSFEVKQGEVVGIIGRNGAGKSTLLKILARVTEPTSGRAIVNGRIGSLLEVGTGMHPELTGRENIYLSGTILGMTKKEIDRKFDEIVEFAELGKFIDTPVKRYSSGMKVRLGFAIAAHLEPEILLVDEVLAVGDAAFQKKCLGKMGDVAKEGRTVLFVSHNMDAIANLCSYSFVLNNGKIIFKGFSESAIKYYLELNKTFSAAIGPILYQGEHANHPDVPQIVSIEMLDEKGAPKSILHTWDSVIFRIHYISNTDISAGSFILEFRDYKQQRLIVLDSGTKIRIRRGKNWVDCIIQKFPLASGEYYIGAGLAISRMGWLWRETNLTVLRVYGKDVFGLGRPVSVDRMLFAVEHIWRAP